MIAIEPVSTSAKQPTPTHTPPTGTSPRVIAILVSIAFGIAGATWAVATIVRPRDKDIENRVLNLELVNERLLESHRIGFSNMKDRLNRIEDKLDRLAAERRSP